MHVGTVMTTHGCLNNGMANEIPFERDSLFYTAPLQTPYAVKAVSSKKQLQDVRLKTGPLARRYQYKIFYNARTKMY